MQVQVLGRNQAFAGVAVPLEVLSCNTPLIKVNNHG